MQFCYRLLGTWVHSLLPWTRLLCVPVLQPVPGAVLSFDGDQRVPLDRPDVWLLLVSSMLQSLCYVLGFDVQSPAELHQVIGEAIRTLFFCCGLCFFGTRNKVYGHMSLVYE